MTTRSPPVVLSFGLLDPTGASGALADGLSVAAMGCHLSIVATCIAVQDTRERSDLFVIDEELLDDQARAVLQDMPVAAIKIGAIGSTDNLQAIGAVLADYDEVPVVLDPRLDLQIAGGEPVAGGGAEAAAAELAVAMRELLLPQATVLTLNLRQARRLVALAAGADDGVADVDDWTAPQCAARLMQWGASHVLVTAASSLGGRIVNTLFGPAERVQHESLDAHDHAFTGAGDTLSAALAALLAQGIEVSDAVREANEYLAGALAGGYRVGMGDAVPDRLFWAAEDDDAQAGDDDGDDPEPDDGGDVAAGDLPPTLPQRMSQR